MKYLKFYIQTLWYNYSLNPSKILNHAQDLIVALVGVLAGFLSFFTLPFTVVCCIIREIKKNNVDWEAVAKKSWFWRK